VINEEHGYVHRREAFQFQPGIFELCRAAQELGYLLVVVTNQAGIARGYYTEAEFLELTAWMVASFAEQQVYIARVYHCPYHPVHGVGVYKCDSPDRKPKPGMLLRAQKDFSLDLSSSILIGDKLSDIQAAQAAGVGKAIMLRSGASEMEMPPGGCYISDSLECIRGEFFCVSARSRLTTLALT
jgi:D-glycero-D-manno-heptose 1,7-bisphosphate phosphatase